MHASIVRIGNSKGIRIPKRILEQCRIEDEVDLVVKGRRIVLTPVMKKPREGWAEAAARMHASGDDGLLIPDVLDDDVHEEWG